MKIMKFKGKVAAWFYLLIFFILVMQYPILFSIYKDGITVDSMISLVIIVLLIAIFISIIFINYVELNDEYMLIVFSFIKKKIYYEDIISLTETNNPLSSLAASLDRIEIKCKKETNVMISILDKKSFYKEIKLHNTNIEIYPK